MSSAGGEGGGERRPPAVRRRPPPASTRTSQSRMKKKLQSHNLLVQKTTGTLNMLIITSTIVPPTATEDQYEADALKPDYHFREKKKKKKTHLRMRTVQNLYRSHIFAVVLLFCTASFIVQYFVQFCMEILCQERKRTPPSYFCNPPSPELK